ncbi:ATP-binding protein [Streptomyces sp. NPDC048441]|uniref:ATP-binding protein n=1 Tax=Streptomyces sp. NPDC048441 TaxID=3365552 RepID=UPI003720DCEB
MSHLRAPAARADRREGGRHGRPGSRPAAALPEARIRPQLLRIAVLPAVAVALCAGAAVLFVVRSTPAPLAPALLLILAAAGAISLASVVIAAVAADRTATSVRDRVGTLRRTTARGQADLREVVEQLRRGDGPPARRAPARTAQEGDEFGLLADDLSRAQDVAVTAVVQASQLSRHADSEQKVEVFVNMARRLQSLVHREISILDDLENDVEDPELLKGLFHVDHLATRIRRHAENLAVLGGAISRRQWSNPVSMTEVLRSAIAEVEQYSRVKLVPPIAGTLRGHAVADVIHLLAELVENATVFSAPHTQVLMRANLVTAGLAIEVEDRGLGMPVTEQNKMNHLLADPDQVNVASLLQDGRIGLYVVAALARRHNIAVRLQTNIYGGVQAVLILPQGLLGADAQNEPVPAGRPQPAPEAAPPGAPGGVQETAQAPPTAAALYVEPVSVPRQPQRDAPLGAPSHAPVTNGSGPAPLPVRGREGRPTPAEAVPGIRPEDRQAAAEHAGTPPTPLNGVVHDRLGKPRLPKRRAQEHIAPQLRDAPTPRPESEELIGHDPGLMAAFQRGIGLAAAQEMRDPAAEPGLGVPRDGGDQGG